MERKACCHITNASVSLVHPISKMSKKCILVKSSGSQLVNNNDNNNSNNILVRLCFSQNPSKNQFEACLSIDKVEAGGTILFSESSVQF